MSSRNVAALGKSAVTQAGLLAVALDALAKARTHRGALRQVWNDLSGLVRLVRAWALGNYRQVSWRTIALAAGALLYFLDPFDVVPDQIPLAGYVDDAAVITLVVNSIRDDIERYVRWDRRRKLGAKA